VEKKRILIVDDEVEPSRIFKLNLEQTGCYEAMLEHRPEYSIATARSFQPHLVLLDVLMPHMLGGNVAAAFESDAALKNTPIVFLTAAVQRRQVDAPEGIISNHPCLAKPAGLEEIVRIIEKNIGRPHEQYPFRMHMLPREATDEN